MVRCLTKCEDSLKNRSFPSLRRTETSSSCLETQIYTGRAEYRVRVFAFPKEVVSRDGEALRFFGRTDLALAYFKEALLVHGEESPVFEWEHGEGLQLVANDFEEWLIDRARYAKERFSGEEWRAIVAGPAPFSDEELSIVEARRQFRWRVVGISPSGNIRFEVHNSSKLRLPFLSIGIRGPIRNQDNILTGGVWLPIDHIGPGETRVVEKDCYKDRIAPETVETFDEPDPRTEDRDRYWEFGQP